jgi:DNA-binding LacI/PurR family transcriptional regulator
VADPRKRQVLPGRKLNIGILCNVTITPSMLWNSFMGTVIQGFLQELGMEEVAPTCPAVPDDQDTRLVWQSKEHNVSIQCLGEAVLSHARHPTLSGVKAGNFDGLMAVSIVEKDWLQELIALGRPTVLSDYAGSDDELDADVVYLDPSSGFRRATMQMVSSGCRHIHFVGALMSAASPKEMMSPEEWRSGWNQRTRVDPDTVLRLNAFRNALEECGSAVDEGAIHFTRGDRNSIVELGETLAKLSAEKRPDGIICHESAHAEILMETFGRLGHSLQGAGATMGPIEAHAQPVFADGRTVGAVSAELLTSRLTRPLRPHMRVGVKMRYRSQAEKSHHKALAVSANG